jgi:V8-like Glu-specific endopeptidase
MTFDYSTFKKELDQALSLFDTGAAQQQCNELVNHLTSAKEDFPVKQLEYVLQALRNKRMFRLMQQMADCFLHTGHTSYKIRRQYAQALIDQGIYYGALAVLNELKADTGNDKNPAAETENREAIGLMGRIYKQLYINAGKSEHSGFIYYLKLAMQSYQGVYSIGARENLWQGINLASLIRRAEADGIVLNGFPEAGKIASEILHYVGEKDEMQEAKTWDFATAMEACIVIDKGDEALAWANKYVNSSYADAFEIGSTLRQLKELWRLNEDEGIGKKILPLLQAALLRKQGGAILLQPDELQKQRTADREYAKNLELVFGNASYKAFDWYLKGKDRCYPVARIGRTAFRGVGTGFLLEGKELHPDLKDEIVLLTNAHVVSNDQVFHNGSLKPEEAVVIFEALDKNTELRIEKLYWTSPSNELDVSVLLFDEKSREKLNKLKAGIIFYPVARTLPKADGKERLYIIGHPNGESLQISLQDNVFLAANDRYLHYRTPTVPGSSGSPVFDENWGLVAIHHSGSFKKLKMDGTEGRYEANEGIWIQSIINKIRESI